MTCILMSDSSTNILSFAEAVSWGKNPSDSASPSLPDRIHYVKPGVMNIKQKYFQVDTHYLCNYILFSGTHSFNRPMLILCVKI